MDIARFTYFQCQFTITFAFVIWVYVRRHHAYTLLRNVLFATFMLAVPGYILYPTAPPRLLPSEGFTDPLMSATLNQQGTLVTLFGNPYAAMPSLHTATAILVGARRARHATPARPRHLGVLPRPGRLLDRGHRQPLLPDAVAGAGVLAVALAIVLTLHRRKGWSIAPLSDRSSARIDRSSIGRASA